MRNIILTVCGTAFIGTAAIGARPPADRNDNVHMSCVIEQWAAAEPKQVTPIMQLTLPWMPAGSSEASTRTFVEASFRELIVSRGIKFKATYCLTGATMAEVRERIASWKDRQGPGHKTVALDPNDIFPPVFDRMYRGQSIGRPEITRARYTAVLVAPHPK